MTRTLLDVLEEANWIDAAVTLDGIPPEDRDALEVGLLLAEVERLRPGVDIDVDRMGATWIACVWNPRNVSTEASGEGPTLHAALTALLAQLPKARSSADLINDETASTDP